MDGQAVAVIHVLVVEDEDNLRRTFVRCLAQRGYRVSEARTAAWAMDVCQDDLPDAIVLDINLPDGSGWDVLRSLRARDVSPPPVVAISAVPPTRTRLAEFEPITFLPKPFAIQSLLRAVSRAVSREERHETMDHFAV